MNLEQVARLLTDEGKETRYIGEIIKEILPPYSNYHEICKVGDNWILNLVVVDHQNTPVHQQIATFTSEDSAAIYFYIDRLSSFYSKKYVRKFIQEQNDLDIGGELFDLPLLIAAIERLKIEKFFSNGVINLKPMSILLNNINETDWKICFVNSNMQILDESQILDRMDALFYAFTNTYLLSLLQSREKELLDQGEITEPFSDGEYIQFIA
ncbi:hypothetical protein HCA73_04855 [Listeria booriae]|uniref:hypothetical protein n=1 Tax=Listeria booriae TaxID=1552123 RepID=UPI0016250E2B|nr:hypothetical protein [Listeria booriae]MBC1911965.1 hypothetical protein [Listeria booriae]MBC2067631.1 hypothetical protein [Listeria booriae]